MAWPEAEYFIRRIKNKHKRDYGKRYLAFRRGQIDNEPQGSAAGLSKESATGIATGIDDALGKGGN